MAGRIPEPSQASRSAEDGTVPRQPAAPGMQDYSVGRQTGSGGNGPYKPSSQYSNVWSSPVGPALSDGRTFGSTDNTVDPNTATDNNWTKDTKDHGNGQPYSPNDNYARLPSGRRPSNPTISQQTFPS